MCLAWSRQNKCYTSHNDSKFIDYLQLVCIQPLQLRYPIVVLIYRRTSGNVRPFKTNLNWMLFFLHINPVLDLLQHMRINIYLLYIYKKGKNIEIKPQISRICITSLYIGNQRTSILDSYFWKYFFFFLQLT